MGATPRQGDRCKQLGGGLRPLACSSGPPNIDHGSIGICQTQPMTISGS